jgi:hypothetical protein
LTGSQQTLENGVKDADYADNPRIRTTFPSAIAKKAGVQGYCARAETGNIA